MRNEYFDAYQVRVQCLEHDHNQDYVNDDRLTRWEDSQLLEEVVEQKQSMSPPFKKKLLASFYS